MKTLQELQILIQKELNTINFPIEPKNLYDPIKYVLDIGGKRMRPILTLMAINFLTQILRNLLKQLLE